MVESSKRLDKELLVLFCFVSFTTNLLIGCLQPITLCSVFTHKVVVLGSYRHSPRGGFFRTAFDESIPCLTNALGAKGVGELGTIGATPAVVNAVVDALARAGRGEQAERLQMPLTAERVWRALQPG